MAAPIGLVRIVPLGSGSDSDTDQQCFGKAEWNKHIGDVGEEPRRTDELESFLQSPCPFSNDPSILVKHTHFLVMIPETLTVDNVTALVKQLTGIGIHFEISDFEKEGIKRGRATSSYWAVMTRDEILETRGLSYEKQWQFIERHEGYLIPSIVHAIFCMLAKSLSSKVRQVSDLPITYINCDETSEKGHPYAIGNFGSEGLRVIKNIFDKNDKIGTAAIRLF